MQELLQYVPEVVVVGDIEFLFLGAAFALGMPKMARRILNKRYGDMQADDSDTSSDSDGGN